MKEASKLDYVLNNEQEGEELVTRKQIDDSPFTIIGTEGKFFGTVGKYRITEPMKTEKAVEKELKDITWNRIVQVMLILIETQEKIKV